jgi:hypothetical protein
MLYLRLRMSSSLQRISDCIRRALESSDDFKRRFQSLLGPELKQSAAWWSRLALFTGGGIQTRGRVFNGWRTRRRF